MRIIYVGTSSFGIPVLRKLISLGEDVVAVITQPDRPAGRGKKMHPSPIKEVALEYGLQLFQPENINSESAIEKIRKFEPELIILIAYGQIISGEILKIPPRGCLNVHPSLLPYYKGSAPIQWTIIQGEQETGISFLFMNEKIDAGDIILQKKTEIVPDENYQELSERLSIKSAEIMADVLDKIKKGDYKKIPQPRGKYFYARKINKIDCKINWNNRGVDILNLVRGIAYTPCAYTEFKGKRIKITKVFLLEPAEENREISERKPGDIVSVSKEGIQVLAGDHTRIVIKRLILPGSKEMDVSQFINGYQIRVGDSFINLQTDKRK
ncbi:MAG TPA: methionyl-tRNA formyltransferase [Atribacterota bacterium]|nr:methionyl-tRNA formyltransferase [Atribacterota bacterium]